MQSRIKQQGKSGANIYIYVRNYVRKSHIYNKNRLHQTNINL